MIAERRDLALEIVDAGKCCTKIVSDTPTALRPVSQGVLLPAPGIPDAHDYSQVMAVDFVRGRYVKLVCKAYLANSSHAGLSEVQVLGY